MGHKLWQRPNTPPIAAVCAARARRSRPLPPPASGCGPKPVRHQVAPASAHGAGSVPGGLVTTRSKWLSASAPRSSRISAASSPSASGPGRSIGNRPSQRAARRRGRRWGQRDATQTGIRGACSGPRLELAVPVFGELAQTLVEQPGAGPWHRPPRRRPRDRTRPCGGCRGQRRERDARHTAGRVSPSRARADAGGGGRRA